MKRVIYKYEFQEEEIHDGQDFLKVPGGKVVHVEQQGTSALPTVWIEHVIVPDSGVGGGMPEMTLRIAGTGHPIPEEYASWKHVGSCICGPFVWHVYADRQD